MTDKYLLEKAIYWFRVIAEDMERITASNLSYNAAITKGRAIRAYKFLGKHKGEQPVSEDLKEAADEYANSDEFNDKAFLIGYDEGDLAKCFIEGANWQKKNLWKDAQGDDLPPIDREVIALQGRKVVFAHRPNPEGWDGKSLSTGEVEHYTPQTFDKGGWNMPDIKYWLDASLPEGIE